MTFMLISLLISQNDCILLNLYLYVFINCFRLLHFDFLRLHDVVRVEYLFSDTRFILFVIFVLLNFVSYLATSVKIIDMVLVTIKRQVLRIGLCIL